MNDEHKFQFGPEIASKMRRHENMGRASQVAAQNHAKLLSANWIRSHNGKAIPEPILTFILLACKICMQFLPHSHSRNFNLFAAKIIRELIASVSLSVCVCSQMFVA